VLLFVKAEIKVQLIIKTLLTIKERVSWENKAATAINDADSAEIPAAAVKLRVREMFLSLFFDRIVLDAKIKAAVKPTVCRPYKPNVQI
jgi:hypothetical protein